MLQTERFMQMLYSLFRSMVCKLLRVHRSNVTVKKQQKSFR